MTAAEIVILALLILAAGICWMCSLGILVMHGVYDKLHYLAPAGILGTLCIAAAVFIREGFTASGVKVLLVLGAFLISNPIITQAAAVAHKIRDSRRSNVEPEKQP